MLITELYGLSKNGTDWTQAFKTAIDSIEKAGGGVLKVPAGTYPTGAICLCSHIRFEIEAGACLSFIPDTEHYPLIPLEFEGIRSDVHTPCIYAKNAECITLCGDGTVNGNGDFWWKTKREGKLDAPRPYLVCFDSCAHVTIENLYLKNSPVWTVHPYRCSDVIIRGLRIKNPWDSPNTDGIDPDSCVDVRISDCSIDVGDDCIAIKSGTQDTPDKKPCEHIIITNCHFLHGHGGIVLGSEMSGNVRNVLVNSCIFHNTDRGVRLKTRRGRGGTVEGVRLANLIMESVKCPFVFNSMYYCGKGGKEPVVGDKRKLPVDEGTPALKDVHISNVVARKCTAAAGWFYGLPEMPIEGVILRDIEVEMIPGTPGLAAMMDGCEMTEQAGMTLRNVRGFRFENVKVKNVIGTELDTDDTVEFI